MKNKKNYNVKKSESKLLYQKILDTTSLTKLIVSTSVTFTTFTGYTISKRIVDLQLLFTLAGVFLLAAGASALNHIIEHKTDALMPRTKNRPLPSGRMTLGEALIIAFLFLSSGLAILYFYTNIISFLLGFFNVVWYNAIYTPLKKISVWAVFVGTITGIIPFFIGITSATNQLPNSLDYFIGFYMFLWQIPHFFLLICRYGKEYEQAGFVSLTQKSSTEKLVLISYVWMIASCITSLFLPLFGLTRNKLTGFAILFVVLSVFFIISRNVFSKQKSYDFRTPFITTNIMQTAFMLIMIIDSLFVF